MHDYFLIRFLMFLYSALNKVFHKEKLSESCFRHIQIILSIMILYNLERQIYKMRIFIRYFFKNVFFFT